MSELNKVLFGPRGELVREFPPPPPAFGVGQDPDKVKLESRVMGDYSARFGEHNYDHSSSAEA